MRIRLDLAAMTILLSLAASLRPALSYAADKTDKTDKTDKPEKQKFPGAVVTKLLEGWGGLAWGGTLDDFKKKYADAKQNEAGRWLTGKDDEIAGVKVTVQYTFNKKDQLQMVTFVPEEKASKTFRQALDTAGALKGAKGNWTNQGLTFAVAPVGDGYMAVAINAKFADPAEKKK